MMTIAWLTPRQRQILVEIGKLSRRGHPPTIRELGETVGLSSNSTVLTHLERLAKKKLVRWNAHSTRTLTLAPDLFEHKGEIYQVELLEHEPASAERQAS